MEIISFQAEPGQVVPASHVFSGCGQPGNLPKYFEHAIFIEVQKARMVLFELPLHGSVMQLHVAVGKCRKWSGDCDQALSFLCEDRQRTCATMPAALTLAALRKVLRSIPFAIEAPPIPNEESVYSNARSKVVLCQWVIDAIQRGSTYNR